MATVGVITPIKDEADNLPSLIASVESQSLQPEAWVIVDDGSTDGSSDLIADAAADHAWIHHRERTDSTAYDIGVHYARVIADGYAALCDRHGEKLDYYMILDGDMELSPGYIESVTSYLAAKDYVVIACGPVYTRTDQGLEFADSARSHPFGGATLYDGVFYRSIDGPPLTPCVDSVTKAKSNMRGYRPRYVKDLDERAVQSRPAHSNGDPLANFTDLGGNNYAIGYPPVAALARGFKFATKLSPSRGAAYLRGYFSALASRGPRLVDDDVVAYYHRQKRRDVVRRLRQKLERSSPQ